MRRFGVMVVSVALLSVRCVFAGDDSAVRQMKIDDMQVSASSIRTGVQLFAGSQAVQQGARSLKQLGKVPLLFLYEGAEEEFDFVTLPPPPKQPHTIDNSTRFKMVPKRHDKRIRVAVHGGTLDEALAQFAQSAGLDVQLCDKGAAIVLIDSDLAKDTTWPLNRKLDAVDRRPLKYSEVKQRLVSRYGWEPDSAAGTQLCDGADDMAWKGTEGDTVRDLLVAFLKHGQKRAYEGDPALRSWKFNVRPFYGEKPGQEWSLIEM